ncbi:MAG: hypothetical protein V3T30_01145, partial [Thermodesulfobacteriota bacterium]
MANSTENTGKYKYLIPPLFAVIGLIIYSSAFSGPFYLDDGDNIRNNPAIADISMFLDISGTRYVTYLSFALNYVVSGFSTFGYRLTNVVIHVVNALLVYKFVLLLTRTPVMREASAKINRDKFTFNVALLSGLLFLVHPLQTQAVSYITQRFASLATLFYLLSAVLYIKARLPESKGRTIYIFYILSILSAVLAMKTKEISFTLPVVIIFIEFALFSGSEPVKKRVLYLIPFVLTFAIIPLSLYGPTPSTCPAEGSVAGLLREAQLRDLDKIPR